jgi:hypothetical protein
MKYSKKFRPGRSHELKQQRLTGAELGSAEAYQLRREYAAGVEDQFDHFMRTRHCPEWRTAFDPAFIASERAEFRRRRNKWKRQHRRLGTQRNFSSGPKPEGLVLPPLEPTSQRDPSEESTE